MTDDQSKTSKRIADLQQQYEDAMEAHRKDPADGKAHARTITAAQKLADARQEDRVAQVKVGTRSAGVGITNDSEE